MFKRQRTLVAVILTLVLVVGCGISMSQASTTKYTVANLPKLVGGAWFNRMNEGVIEFAQETGNEAFQTGPDKLDAALQVKEVENLIAQKVDIINVVPISPDTLEPVLKRAMDEGIIVISHEAQGITNVNYDIEAFDGVAYGEHQMERLASAMGYEGEYVICVGTLTSASHMQWANAALAYQEAKYPDMACVNKEAFAEMGANVDKARELASELMRTHANLKGIFLTSATDMPGVALAVEETGNIGKVLLGGTGNPLPNKQYLESGAITTLNCWDPAMAGKAMALVGVAVANGEEIKAGDDLGVPGYESIEIVGNTIVGNAWIDVTLENVDTIGF